MRVLHIAQPTTAGVARVVVDLTVDQVARGWDITVACPSDGSLSEQVQAAGATWLSWEARRSPGFSLAAEAVRLRRLCRTVAPHLVHLHSSKAGMAGRLALGRRTPTVFQPHAWSFLAVPRHARPLAVRWERLGTRWTDALVVVSEREQEIGEQAGVRGPWVLLPNGVDVERRQLRSDEDRRAARRALGVPVDAPLAVCVGRLSRQKGQDVLLNAWHAVRAAVPDARLTLVGEGPERQALALLAPEGVDFAGEATDPDPWLSAADVVALPSRWEAGLSLVAMEAMALGRSVVATDVAGMAPGLSGGAGAVVPVDDAAALSVALVERLRDPALATAEGKVGRGRVERQHDLRHTTCQVAMLYLRVCGRGP